MADTPENDYNSALRPLVQLPTLARLTPFPCSHPFSCGVLGWHGGPLNRNLPRGSTPSTPGLHLEPQGRLRRLRVSSWNPKAGFAGWGARLPVELRLGIAQILRICTFPKSPPFPLGRPVGGCKVWEILRRLAESLVYGTSGQTARGERALACAPAHTGHPHPRLSSFSPKATPALIVKATPSCPFTPKTTQYQPLRVSYSVNRNQDFRLQFLQVFCLIPSSHKIK